jgi:phosphoglycolate phosphatase
MTWLVTDIDGTITDSEGRLDVNAVQTLRNLEAAGVKVGLITGRPYPVVRLLGEYLGVSGPLIGENGGAGVWKEEEFILGDRRIAEEAMDVLREQMHLMPTWDSRYRATDIAIDAPVDIEQVLRLFDAAAITVDLHVSSIMVHISKAGVTKRAGLERACAMAGMDPASVIVAGDADSDAAMFEGFPRSIAPGNSTTRIRELASFCAPSAYGAGFCEGVQQLLRTDNS